jgi:hypothetical protein
MVVDVIRKFDINGVERLKAMSLAGNIEKSDIFFFLLFFPHLLFFLSSIPIFNVIIECF